jgi:adenosine deaminase
MNYPYTYYQSLPKIELHRHLEGSLRLRTLLEVAKLHGMDLVGTDRLRPLVQIRAEDPLTSDNFLSKFQTLRRFYRSSEIIGRITREAIADAGEDNIRYMELRFTPVALSRVENFSLSEVVDWVIEGTQKASQEHGVMTRLIVSVNRHESPEIAADAIKMAIDKKDQGIVGIDLAGDETRFPASPFAGIFQEAREAGLHITVHAGEWGGAGNIAAAITQLGAERIGHGVRVLEDPAVVAMAKERGTAFEVCVTSNYQSGVVSSLNEHPVLKMISAGLNVTINTDDPSISQITLGEEYMTVCEKLNFSMEALRERVLTAANVAFLPRDERNNLVESLDGEFSAVGI